MKKILLEVLFAVVFLCTFLLIFFTGNDKAQFPNETGDETTAEESDEKAPVYDYDLKEYVTLGSFDSVFVDEERINELVDSAVNSIASNFSEKKEVTDRPIKKGDIANIDYVGKMDGVAFEGGTDTGFDLEIGSGSFIPGFEDGLIGHSVGEEVILQLKFPDNYHAEEMKGKETEFTVKINKITEVTVPELTDSMVESLKRDEYKTVAGLEAFLKDLARREVLWEAYVKSCEIKKYPQKEVDTYMNNVISNYTLQAQYYGTTLENLLSAMGFSSLEQFKTHVEADVKNTVATELVIYQTVREKKIEITDDEYKIYALEVATENNIASVAELEKQVAEEYIMTSVYQKKLVDMLYDKNPSGQE